MSMVYLEQSLAAKPWVRAFAIIDPSNDRIVYAAGSGTEYAAQHAKCLMDPSNKLVNRTGKWSTGAFWDDQRGELGFAFAREVGGYTVVVETGSDDVDFAIKRRGAKSLAHASRYALKSAGLCGALYERC